MCIRDSLYSHHRNGAILEIQICGIAANNTVTSLTYCLGNAIFQIVPLFNRMIGGFHPGNLFHMFILIPVSYTHLDVYKRQPLNSRIQILMAHGGDAAHLPINFNSLELSPFSYICLLYTSQSHRRQLKAD